MIYDSRHTYQEYSSVSRTRYTANHIATTEKPSKRDSRRVSPDPVIFVLDTPLPYTINTVVARNVLDRSSSVCNAKRHEEASDAKGKR